MGLRPALAVDAVVFVAVLEGRLADPPCGNAVGE